MDCDSPVVSNSSRRASRTIRQNFDQLPMATLHGDFNDANILLHGDQWGILDVGDCVHSWRVNDLAIGAAYVMVNLCTISASRGAAVHSRHRCDSCSSDEVVGGFFLDFEAIRTEPRDRDAPRRYRRERAERLLHKRRSCGRAGRPEICRGVPAGVDPIKGRVSGAAASHRGAPRDVVHASLAASFPST